MNPTHTSGKNSRLYKGLIEAVAFLDEVETQKDISRLPDLFEYIDSDDTDPAIHSTAKDLAEKLVKGGKDHIIYWLEHGGTITKRICAQSAGEIGLEAAVDPLLAMLENTDDSLLIQNILSAFENMKDERTAIAASRFLDDSDALTVVSAITALKNRTEGSYSEKLAPCLNNSEVIIAYYAAEVLGDIGGRHSAGYLADHIHNEQPSIRRAVAASLIKIGKDAVSVLHRKLRSGDTDEIAATLTVLGEIGDETSIGVVEPFCTHEEANVRYLSYEAVGKSSPAHVSVLAKGLSDKSYAVVCVTINALDRFNTKDSAAAVLKAMAGGHENLRTTLVSAITDMCAHHLFLRMDRQAKVLIKIAECAANSKNPYILNCFIDASDKIENPDLRKKCVGLLKTAFGALPEITGRILVADDSLTMRKFYTSILPKHGFAVDTVEDGLGAIKKFEVEADYDLVLCDLNMPNKNGIELARHIRQELFSNIPILVVTTEVMASQKKEAEAADVNGFLTKPFTVGALVDAICKARNSD